MHWRVCDARNAASDIETIRCIGGFAVPEMLHLTLKRSDALTGFRIFTSEATFNAEAIGCIDEFSNFVKKLHLTLKQSDALTNFRFCQKTASDFETVKCTDGFFVYLSESCILMIECIDGFSICQKAAF